MHNLQNSKEPRSIEVYAEPLYTFERGGSEVSFDTKTFKCVYVNFCSIGIINQPILCENYTSTKVERIYANCNVIYYNMNIYLCLCKFLFIQHYNKANFMRKLYLHKGREDLVTCCNVFVLLQDRWLWFHSSKWFMKLKNLILMSSKIYCMHQQGIDIQLAMAKVRGNKCLCDMYFTQK